MELLKLTHDRKFFAEGGYKLNSIMEGGCYQVEVVSSTRKEVNAI